MTFKINEIFYSLQGEGFWTGTPSVFIRFSRCNLRCPFCDTIHDKGKNMSEEEIIQSIDIYPANHVILTGGEPSLFVTKSLLDKLHSIGKYVAIETNGTNKLPEGIDWITVSPKNNFVEKATPIIRQCDELKIVFSNTNFDPHIEIKANHRFLQPCDTGNSEKNQKILQAAIAFIKENPTWRLSIQTHKIIGIE